MVNIINELEQRNKNLLEENESLKKQLTELANKEQDLKQRIYNAVENVKESENSEVAATLMTLEQHFLPKDEWVKIQEENGVKKTTFGNEFTLKNFVKGCAEWTLLNCNSYDFVSKKNKELTEKKAELETKVVELEKENTELDKTNQELEEALELEEATFDCHLEAFKVAKQWRIRQNKEKDDNLEKASKKIETLESIVVWQEYLSGKQLQDLPSLPKKEKKFKHLTNKIKNRIKQVKAITQEKFSTYILQKDK